MASKVTPLSELREKYRRPETEYLDTGIPSLNDLLGGGLPTGKMVEFHSDAGVGKTTLILQVCKYLIEVAGLKVLFADVENALDASLRKAMGVYEHENGKEPSFLLMSPNSYGTVGQVLKSFVESDYDIFVYDSIANTAVDIKDDDPDAIKQKLGQHALMQTELLKTFKGPIAMKGKCFLVVNQMRANIQTGGFAGAKIKPLRPAGGKSLDHNMDLRVGITKHKFLIDENKNRIGTEISCVTIKNKVAMPFKKIELKLYYGKGVDIVESLMNALIERGVLLQAGGWFSIPGTEVKINGRDKLLAYVKENAGELRTMLGSFAQNVDMDGAADSEVVVDVD